MEALDLYVQEEWVSHLKDIITNANKHIHSTKNDAILQVDLYSEQMKRASKLTTT